MDLDNPTPGTLAWWLDDRRIELGMLWDEVAAKAGITKQTLISIRKGGRMRTATKRNLETAMRWSPGSIDGIKQGFSPIAFSGPGHGDERSRDTVYNQATGVDSGVVVRRLIELIPQIRESHGDERADELTRFVEDTLRQEGSAKPDSGSDTDSDEKRHSI